jgi:hypothetical protein
VVFLVTGFVVFGYRMDLGLDSKDLDSKTAFQDLEKNEVD